MERLKEFRAKADKIIEFIQINRHDYIFNVFYYAGGHVTYEGLKRKAQRHQVQVLPKRVLGRIVSLMLHSDLEEELESLDLEKLFQTVPEFVESYGYRALDPILNLKTTQKTLDIFVDFPEIFYHDFYSLYEESILNRIMLRNKVEVLEIFLRWFTEHRFDIPDSKLITDAVFQVGQNYREDGMYQILSKSNNFEDKVYQILSLISQYHRSLNGDDPLERNFIHMDLMLDWNEWYHHPFTLLANGMLTTSPYGGTTLTIDQYNLYKEDLDQVDLLEWISQYPDHFDRLIRVHPDPLDCQTLSDILELLEDSQVYLWSLRMSLLIISLYGCDQLLDWYHQWAKDHLVVIPYHIMKKHMEFCPHIKKYATEMVEGMRL